MLVRHSAALLYVACLIGCGSMAPQLASAGTIHSTFVSGHDYTCCFGQMVAGPAATNAGVLVGQNQVAGAFTPAANDIVISLSGAFYFTDGPNSNALLLSLANDAAGVPGTTIESWTVSVPSQSNGPSSVVQTVLPLSTIPVNAGTQYWVVASPANPNTLVAWNLNAPGLTAPGGIRAENSGSGWLVFNDSNRTIAFDVQGVPEPGTMLLLTTGLLAVVGFSVKRKLR